MFFVGSLPNVSSPVSPVLCPPLQGSSALFPFAGHIPGVGSRSSTRCSPLDLLEMATIVTATPKSQAAAATNGPLETTTAGEASATNAKVVTAPAKGASGSDRSPTGEVAARAAGGLAVLAAAGETAAAAAAAAAAASATAFKTAHASVVYPPEASAAPAESGVLVAVEGGSKAGGGMVKYEDEAFPVRQALEGYVCGGGKQEAVPVSAVLQGRGVGADATPGDKEPASDPSMEDCIKKLRGGSIGGSSRGDTAHTTEGLLPRGVFPLEAKELSSVRHSLERPTEGSGTAVRGVGLRQSGQKEMSTEDAENGIIPSAINDVTTAGGSWGGNNPRPVAPAAGVFLPRVDETGPASSPREGNAPARADQAPVVVDAAGIGDAAAETANLNAKAANMADGVGVTDAAHLKAAEQQQQKDKRPPLAENEVERHVSVQIKSPEVLFAGTAGEERPDGKTIGNEATGERSVDVKMDEVDQAGNKATARPQKSAAFSSAAGKASKAPFTPTRFSETPAVGIAKANQDVEKENGKDSEEETPGVGNADMTDIAPPAKSTEAAERPDGKSVPPAAPAKAVPTKLSGSPATEASRAEASGDVKAPKGLVRRDGDSGAACKMCRSKWDRDQTLVCCECLMHYHPGCLDPPMTPKEVGTRGL